MNYTKLYSEIKSEFNHDIALLSITAIAIHLSITPSKKDITIKGHFGQKIYKKITQTLWEHRHTEYDHKDSLETVLYITAVFYDYDLCKSLNGLGGCQAKSFTQLITELKEKEKEINIPFNGYYGEKIGEKIDEILTKK